MNKILLCLFAALCGATLCAQPLQLAFRSRALLDASLSGYGTEAVQGYYRLEDFRLGFKASYRQLELKADVGVGGDKVAVKDLLLHWHRGSHTLSVGNGYEPFSMDMLVSTADLCFHQSAASVLAFTDGRKLGVTYHFHPSQWYVAGGAYTHNDLNKVGEGQKNAWVFTSRAVWRLQKADRCLWHVGGAVSFRTREVNLQSSPVATVESDGVTSLFGTPLLQAVVPLAGAELKGLVELLVARPRFRVQAEYFFDRFERRGHGAKAFLAHGGYAQASFLPWGRGFAYDADYAIPGRPASERAVELVARVDHTDLNDSRAAVFGGGEVDFSMGVNCYFNRYVAAKFSGSYVWVGSHCGDFYRRNLFITQLRLQYVF